jgi:hypothetical protein
MAYFDGPCQIRRALIMDSGLAQVDLQADDGSFTWTWFVSSSANSKQVLAAALTALATTRHAYATIPDGSVPLGQLINFGAVTP